MARLGCGVLFMLLALKAWGAGSPANSAGFNPEDLHKAYVYQSQSMKYAQWMYIGFAPRMEDPSRVRVIFSKASYTMRISVELTKEDLAQYPRFLVSKSEQMNQIIAEEGLDVYQWWRMELFHSEINRIRSEYDQTFGYSNAKYLKGLGLLKEKFPTNVFEYPNTGSGGQDDVAAVAHFVYPITINKAGKSFPPNGVFTQDDVWRTKFHEQSPQRQAQLLHARVQERRTDHGARVRYDSNGDGIPDSTKRVVTDYIFSGFPAFWIYPSELGVGVHGPIRFSSPNESRKSEERCETYPRKMREFWQANEFVAAHEGFDMQKDLPSLRLRWDLIRTNNSAGCFRAEPMELRHILPANKVNIYTGVVWEITDQLDRIEIPKTGEVKYVDVNYYILSHYRCPLSREAWVEDRIIKLNRGEHDPKTAAEFIDHSIQFEYNDPATIEFALPQARDHRGIMERLNTISLDTAL